MFLQDVAIIAIPTNLTRVSVMMRLITCTPGASLRALSSPTTRHIVSAASRSPAGITNVSQEGITRSFRTTQQAGSHGITAILRPVAKPIGVADLRHTLKVDSLEGMRACPELYGFLGYAQGRMVPNFHQWWGFADHPSNIVSLC